MLPPVPAPVDPEPVHGPFLLPGRGDDQPRGEIRLGTRFAQHFIREKWALVQEADEVREGGDVVGEVSFPAGPDGDGEGEGVEREEG